MSQKLFLEHFTYLPSLCHRVRLRGSAIQEPFHQWRRRFLAGLHDVMKFFATVEEIELVDAFNEIFMKADIPGNDAMAGCF